MANIIKKAFFGLVDKTLFQEGRVLEIRKWKPESMYEINIQLPETDMNKWKTIPRIKIKVAEFEYRDYSPAMWNAQTRICTVFIETNHQGPGSLWVKNLKVDDTFQFGAAYSAQLPANPVSVLCFGDGSALGHFMALKQLLMNNDKTMDVILSLNEDYQIPEYLICANPEFEFIKQSHGNSLLNLHQRSERLMLGTYSAIFLAGYIPMVYGLKKILRTDTNITARIFAHGFWT